MKPIIILAFTLGLALQTRAADTPAEPVNPPPASAPSAATAPDSGTNQPAEVAAAENVAGPETGTNHLRMNFRGAPLNLVLDYLSDAAGFIINKEADVRGTVDVWSKQPISKEEAVDLLNSVLRKNGYAVTRNNRILTIVSMDTAKTADLDIISGSDPNEVERSDEVVTQIIPVRHASASQLMNNLQVLLPTSATLSVNESANSLILVATKRDIRRMLKIVTALDTSIASVSSIQVFLLKYADARQLATVVQQLFAPTTGGMGNNPRGQLFNMFRGGGGGGGPFGGGGPGGGGGAPGQGGNAAGARVVASADDYSNSLIVSASPDLMNTISNMVAQVDQPVSDVTAVKVFHLINSDPTELADIFTQLFPDDTRSSDTSNRSQRFRVFGGGGGRGGFGGRGSTGSDSDRMRKKTRVIAVPDQRTSSLIVTAAADMMDQIEEMVQQLDSNSAKKEKVAVFDLQNADPQDVYQVLQDLFNRNSTMRNNNANTRGSMLGANNPLTQRATQQQQNYNNSSRTGGSRGGGGGAGSSLGF